MKIALCIIATGKYTRFLPFLLESAERFFCPGHDRRFFVFTDDEYRVPSTQSSVLSTGYCVLGTLHEPWPGPTLHRYRTMLRAAGELAVCDYVYYIDVDSRFVRPTGEEILCTRDLVATIHFGFYNKPRKAFTYEYRPASRACVSASEGRRYYAGGFQGGRADRYMAAMRAMDAAIADDERRGITAWWHDESHWNRYLIDHPPAVELGHDYMCPADPLRGCPGLTQTQRIVIVEKNNREVRT
jgi:histo-blood group ABO system transferase